MSSNDGGPAFPSGLYADENRSGMSLRDWFAGQALAALLANPDAEIKDSTPATQAFSEASYLIADAMLSARNPTQPNGEPK